MSKNNKINKSLLQLLYMSALFQLLHSSLQAQQIRGNCTGMVTDEQGSPLSGASIRLEPDGHTLQSDKKGQFLFKNIIAGNYRIHLSMVGKTPFEGPAVIHPGKTAELKICLVSNNSQLNEVQVAGAQQSPDNLLDVQRGAMPVTVITRSTLDKMGSRRLDEVLKEQTGFAVVNDIGGGARAVGIQMQGFGSEYVMILIDGQPMAGRNNGSFDLSRISVSNIERIEIIKGASSCLFGSEALGGAINIITRHGAIQPQGLATFRYGSLHIADATLEGETPFASQRGSINLSGNYYRTDGFNTDPKYLAGGTTAPPYRDYSIQGRARYRTSAHATAGISGRYAKRSSYMEQIFAGGTATNTSGDTQNITDLNLSATFEENFENGWRSMSRYYLTRYRSDRNVVWQQTNSTASDEAFNQTLHRVEQQFAHNIKNKLKFTGGLGGNLERMDHTGYAVSGNMWGAFAYMQGDWKISNRLEAVGGWRYDHHNSYGGRLNPSLGMQFHINPAFTFKLAMGSGFKAPDFKQRYQVFMNPVNNYLVIGTEVLWQTLEEMKNAGEISEVRDYLVEQLSSNLQAERSTSFNGGFVYQPSAKLKVDAGAFYHDIRNQINSIRVATGTSIRDIYTYQNLPRSVNKGLETSVVYQPFSDMELSAGYQYLISKDQSVADSIRKGNFPYNTVRDNQTGAEYAAKPSDYFGIENRSRHMLNLRVFYTYRPLALSANIRANYRGKYPFGDRNNNQFIDKYDTFVNGFFLINMAIEKKILNSHLSLQLTADNLFDYIDRLMPGQPGRIILGGLSYRFYKD